MSSFTTYPNYGPDKGIVKDLTPAAATGTAADAVQGSLKRLFDRTQRYSRKDVGLTNGYYYIGGGFQKSQYGPWATVNTCLSRVSLVLPYGGSSLRVAQFNYANVGLTITGPITHTTAIELANGRIMDAPYNGRGAATLDRSGPLLTDPVEADVATGGTVWVRNFSDFTGNDTVFESLNSSGSVARTNFGTPASVYSGTITAGSDNYGVGGRHIIGRLPAGLASLVALGDSITPAYLNNVNLAMPCLRVDWGGQKFPDYTNGANFQRLSMARYGTHVLVCLGANDFGVDAIASFATMQARATQLCNYLAGLDLKVVICTVTPHTNSTDGFITTANQSAFYSTGVESARVQYNDWLRTLPIPSIYSVIDGANAVETSLNSGKWKTVGGAALTGDGLHPNTLGNTTLSALVTPATFN